MTITTYGIGTTLGGIVTLKSLNIPVPIAPYKLGDGRETLSSGKQINTGAPNLTWRWGFLTLAQRTVLRTYCTGVSSDVFIWSKVNDLDAFRAFQCIMNWPEEESRTAAKRLDFDVLFTYLVDVTP
jgi:hypothetical protein